MESICYRKLRHKTVLTWVLGIYLITGNFINQANAGSATKSIENALKGDWGQINFNLNWRYENVDQAGLGSANGDPVRLRLGYLSPKILAIQAFLEFEGNTPVFVGDYNSLRNGKTRFPVIADPQETELNQGWLVYSGIPDTEIKAGRQRIKYDNDRFIGNVGWRQLEQTFDSVSVINKSLTNTEIQGAFLWNVKNILSRNINMTSPILNIGYTMPKLGKLTGYVYFLDYSGTNPGALRFSTQTYGLRLNGKAVITDNLNALYTAEYAYQQDYQNNPNHYKADYFHIVGGLEIPAHFSGFTGLTGKAGWEQLGSANDVGLQTPLGTDHAFNGWADKFLLTPPKGIQDLYGSLSVKLFGIKLMTVYHQFDSAVGGIDYGHEIDALAVKKFAKHYTVLFKYANYFARNFATDTQKFWISIGIDY